VQVQVEDSLSPAQLRTRRKALGLSQQALARAVGVTTNTIARWERGERRIAHAQLLHIGLERLEGSKAATPAAPTRSLAARRLPLVPNRLIGRERDVAHVCELLLQTDVRLVTITGVGGIGKTRLGVEAAQNLERSFADGVFFVDLAPVGDPALFLSAIARPLGIQDSGVYSLAHTLQAWLQNREVLLLLDNFEHLIMCGPVITGLLEACEHLKVLVTSRTVLKLRWEHEYAIAGLSLPADDDAAEPAHLARIPSVALYLERVQAVLPSFTVSDSNARDLARLAIRLDGLPLAIELAAARAKFGSTSEILGRLGHRFEFLVSGQADRLERHHTLLACLEWSYELLSAEEQRLLRTLSVFAGGFTLGAVEAVHGTRVGFRSSQIRDSLEGLVDQSLVLVDHSETGTRYRLLETIREFAQEKASVLHELDEAARQHARYFVELAESCRVEFIGRRQVVVLDILETEHANLRGALGWLLGDARQPVLALRLCAALYELWFQRGYAHEGVRCLKLALGLAPSAAQPLRADALHGLGSLSMIQGDSTAIDILKTSVDLFVAVGATRGAARALATQGYAELFQGQLEAASASLARAQQLAAETNDEWTLNYSLFALGLIAQAVGDLDRAVPLLYESLSSWRRHGDPTGLASALGQVGFVEWACQRFRLGYQFCREGLVAFHEIHNPWGIALCVAGLARAAALHEDWRTVVRLTAAAEALRTKAGAAEYPQLAWAPMQIVATARQHLSPASADLEW
jgi:predicted ATPase